MFPHFSTMYILTIILECDSLFLVCIEKNTSAIKTSMFGDAVIADSCKGKSKYHFHKALNAENQNFLSSTLILLRL